MTYCWRDALPQYSPAHRPTEEEILVVAGKRLMASPDTILRRSSCNEMLNLSPLDYQESKDPVYKKLGIMHNECYRRSYIRNWGGDGIVSSHINDLMIDIENRRRMGEQEYTHLLNTPLEDLLKEFSENLKSKVVARLASRSS